MKRIAWVTGASKGLGKSITQELLKDGWSVAITSRNLTELEAVAEEFANFKGEARAYPLDITDNEEVERTVNIIERDLGKIDLAILNAGTYIRFGADEFSMDLFNKQININLLGTVNCIVAVLNNFKVRKSGHIAVVSSLSAYRGLPYASAYGASKAALSNICESLKPELDNLNICLSLIHPGFVRTPLTSKNDFQMPFIIDSEIAAKEIVKGIESKKFEISFPFRFVFIMKLLRLLPYWLYFKLTKKLVKR